LEDKLVQRAIADILQAIYETEFHDSAYGFRPGRHQHHALNALIVAIEHGKVSWSWVRFADHVIVCFQYREDAERFHAGIQERLAKFLLELHSAKTRVQEFGRFAA
jgi:retron-type reverse transcriptase